MGWEVWGTVHGERQIVGDGMTEDEARAHADLLNEQSTIYNFPGRDYEAVPE